MLNIQKIVWIFGEIDSCKNSSSVSNVQCVVLWNAKMVVSCINPDSLSFQSPTPFEDQPISIKSSIVDIAYDYTKKKNVFRLTTYNGSEYLFQADDHDAMLQWIRMIQDNNNPEEDVSTMMWPQLIGLSLLSLGFPLLMSESL